MTLQFKCLAIKTAGNIHAVLNNYITTLARDWMSHVCVLLMKDNMTIRFLKPYKL